MLWFKSLYHAITGVDGMDNCFLKLKIMCWWFWAREGNQQRRDFRRHVNLLTQKDIQFCFGPILGKIDRNFGISGK